MPRLEPSEINGVKLIETLVHRDPRGTFSEKFRSQELNRIIGKDFRVAQINQSVSKNGVIRGIHWADNPPGQKKFVFCSYGQIVDVAVDLRKSSPTFGNWTSFTISSENGSSVFLDDGIGHAFLSLEAGSTVTYLCSEKYSPNTERSINPFDSFLAIDWKSLIPNSSSIDKFIVSTKDEMSMSLEAAIQNNLLPN